MPPCYRSNRRFLASDGVAAGGGSEPRKLWVRLRRAPSASRTATSPSWRLSSAWSLSMTTKPFDRPFLLEEHPRLEIW